MARFSAGASGEPQHMIACSVVMRRVSASGSSSRRWNCTGTKPPCVMPWRSIASTSAAALNDGSTTRVPPTTTVHSIATQLMFE